MIMYVCLSFLHYLTSLTLKPFLALHIFYCMMKNRKIETDAGRFTFIQAGNGSMIMYVCTTFLHFLTPLTLKLILALQIFYCMMENRMIVKRYRYSKPCYLYIDGSSEHVAHEWSKIGLFRERKSDLTPLRM